MTSAHEDGHRLHAARRDGEQVTTLELFFDLVFVLALTQSTALMADDPTWAGLGRGLLALAVLWWSWVGYAWLTSVIDPEEGAVRAVMFLAMAAFLVSALCVPEAFGDLGLTFAVAFGILRGAHIALFVLASRDDADLRRSVTGLAISTTLGVAVLVGASYTDGATQGLLWAAAVVVDVGGPYLFGSSGWRLEPKHFADRHGLIILIALGESIVAIGIGAERGVDNGVILAALLGLGIAATMWWTYFDLVSLITVRYLVEAEPGREQNEIARDAYSLLHFPMVAGIVLLAFGLKTTLAHVHDHLGLVPATALVGGLALYLLAHVAFKYRILRTVSGQRLLVAGVVVLLLPVVRAVPAVTALVLVNVVMWALILYENLHFAETRSEVRHHPEHGAPAAGPGHDAPAADPEAAPD